MQVWNLLHAARWKCRTQKCHQKSPSGHHRTTLSGYIFATKARIDNRKKLVKQRYVLHMSPQYGELRPTSGWDPSGSLRHPCKVQRVSHLGSVTARHLVVGVSQTLRRWTEGATCVRQGDHHVGHWPTFCVSCSLVKKHAAFKWKDKNSRFPVSPGSAEALVRCGRKIKYILIAYFLGNICAKNCCSPTVYVKIIASSKGGTFFWDTVYILNHGTTVRWN